METPDAKMLALYRNVVGWRREKAAKVLADPQAKEWNRKFAHEELATANATARKYFPDLIWPDGKTGVEGIATASKPAGTAVPVASKPAEPLSQEAFAALKTLVQQAHGQAEKQAQETAEQELDAILDEAAAAYTARTQGKPFAYQGKPLEDPELEACIAYGVSHYSKAARLEEQLTQADAKQEPSAITFQDESELDKAIRYGAEQYKKAHPFG